VKKLFTAELSVTCQVV